MRTTQPRARDCIRTVSDALQRNDLSAQAQAIDAYMRKTDQAPEAYRTQKLQKLVDLAKEAGVFQPVVDLVRTRAGSAGLDPVIVPTPSAPPAVGMTRLSLGRHSSGASRAPAPPAVQARESGHLWQGYALLAASASRKQLLAQLQRDAANGMLPTLAAQAEPDAIHADAFWDALAEVLTARGDARVIAAFLQRGAYAKPVVDRADEHGLDAMLRKLSLWGRDVTAWARVGGEYVFVHQPFEEAVEDGEIPGYGGLYYRVVSAPVAERLDLAAQLEEAHQQIVGMSIGRTGDEMSTLVRPLPHGVPVLSTRFVMQQRPLLGELGQSGYVCGAGWRSGGPYSAPEGRHEIFFAVCDDSRRYLHASMIGNTHSLAGLVEAARIQAFVVCGILEDAAGVLNVIIRKRVVALRASGAVPRNTEREINAARTNLLSGNDDVALTALATVMDASEQGPWQRHASPLREFLSLLPAQPWAALSGLAKLTTEPDCVGSFAFDMQWLLKRWCERIVAEPAPEFLRDVRAQLPTLDHLPRASITEQLLWASTQGAGTPSAALQSVISRNWVGRAAVVSAVCGEIVYESEAGEPSPYERACATGNPCLAAAIDGDIYAPLAWKRMSRQQRLILTTLGLKAHARSMAARADLQSRIATLRPDIDAATETEKLRRYLRRDADVWVNFHLNQGATDALNYIPKSASREELEKKRFSGLYHRSENKHEQRPIYGFLNGQSAVHGFVKFGLGALVLSSSVRSRTTVVARRVHDNGEMLGTLHAMDHVLTCLTSQALANCIAAMNGSKMLRPSLVEGAGGVPSEVIEAHVHGPLSLAGEVRKIVATPSASLKLETAEKVGGMAAHLGLPLRWRGQIEAVGNECEDLSAALLLASELGVHISSWIPGQSTPTQIFHTRSSSDGRVTSPYRYDLMSTTLKNFEARLGTLARDSTEVAAFRVAAYTGRGAQSARKVDAIVRSRIDMGTDTAVALRRTFSLGDKLQQLADTNWRVQAITGVQVPDSTSPLFHIVVEQTPNQRFVSRIVPIERTSSRIVENAVAELRKDSWTWVGFANYRPDDRSTMLFQRAAHPLPVRPHLTPYANAETLIGLDPINTVPAALLFVSDTHHAFDIDELMDMVEARGAWVNPYTGQAFSDADVTRILAHPSGAGPAMASRLASESNGIAAISDDTAQRIITMGRVLEQDNPDGTLVAATRAVEAFQTHARTLPAAEQTALFGARFQLTDTHQSAFMLSVMQALVGVQAHTGCSRATGRYLQTMGRAVLASHH